MKIKNVLLLALVTLSNSFCNATYRIMDWEAANPAFDTSLYENALDPVECEKQLSLIQSDSNLRLQFLDAGLRIPRAILMGNTIDMGNYHGCLGIHQSVEDSTIQGKYCMLNVPANQEISLPELPEFPGFPEFPEGIFPNGTFPGGIFPNGVFDVTRLNQLRLNEELMEKLHLFMKTNAAFLTPGKRLRSVGDFTMEINFRMAVCIPKACTVGEGLSGLVFNVTLLGLQYEEQFCRLPNDKPWAPADYVAIVLFSAIGLITIISTLYDLRNRYILRKVMRKRCASLVRRVRASCNNVLRMIADRVDYPKLVNPLYSSFSVYTNAHRLTTFTKNPGALECVDGIRALSTLWIIIGHTAMTIPQILNILEVFDWITSFRSIWITSAPIAVDTFFMMSGMLLVYTTAGKMTSSKLIQNLHLFYLNRILRMFPLLAACILAQASFFHWVSDGPLWENMAANTNTCRNYWWLSLLYVQNFFTPICLGHSWYLAIDMQLHILSPILLYFVLSNNKRQAWVVLVVGLLASLTASTIYIFMKQLKGAMIQLNRPVDDHTEYMLNYYLYSLTRAPPFFVGLIFGYILYLCRNKPKFSTSTVFLLWGLIISLGALSLYSPEPMKDLNYDNQTLDSTVNAFARSSWAIAVACLIVVCVNGYGGPVNWLLSLQMWKLTSRISYAMYLSHYPIMYAISGSYVQPIFFTEMGIIYAFFSQMAISFIVGFFVTLIIDSPFSTLFKQLLGGGPKKPEKEELLQNNNTVYHEDLCSTKIN